MFCYVLPGCVDSVIDDASTTYKPTITIASPVEGTNSTVHVGLNLINYTASDYSGGQGLSFLQVILNGNTDTPNYEDVVTDGELPVLYLDIPRDLLGETIDYYVVVYNLDGGFQSSDIQNNLTVVEAPPGTPYNLVLVAVNEDTGDIRLIWDDDSDNVIDYWVYQKIENGSWTRVGTVSAPQKTFSMRINPIVDNYFKIAGWNTVVANEDDLLFSEEVNSGSTINSLNLSAEAIGASKVIVSWDNPWGTAVNVFEIERLSGYSTTWDSTPDYYVVGSPDAVIYFTDTNVSSSSTYTYRIRRRMLADDYRSAWSNSVSVATYTSNISAPTGFYATQYASRTIRLVWDLTYVYTTQIERCDNPYLTKPVYTLIGTKEPGLPISSTSSQTEYYDTSVTSGKWYDYRIRFVLGSNAYTEWKHLTSWILGP